MSEERRVIALFKEANPVPDEQTIERPHPKPAAYLATLRQRSSEVTQEEARREAETTGGRKGWIWAAAALLAVLIGVVTVLTSQGSGESTVLTQPATTQAETPTTQTETPTTQVENSPTTRPAETEVTEVPQSAPDASLNGTWRSTGVELTFDNGRYQLGAYVGPNPADIVDQGTYTTESNQVTLTTSGASAQGCAPGDSRTLTYEVTPGQSLTVTGAGDECLGRGNLLTTPLDMIPAD